MNLSAESDNWYQVEIIVFTLINPATSDEIWPVNQMSYPHKMVNISPQSDDIITPYTQEQLDQILALEEFLPSDDMTPDVISRDSPVNDFVFNSRSRFSVNQPEPEPEPETTIIDDTVSSDEEISLTQAEYLNEIFNSTDGDAFRSIRSEDRFLNNVARSIRRSSLYRMMLHQAWRQPVLSVEESIPVLIQAGKHYDDSYEIDGTINVSRSRYLHVATDLWYTEFMTAYAQPSSGPALDLIPYAASKRKYPAVTQWESERGKYLPLQSHRLEQSRKMRSSTLHYIDHPAFGILVRIDEVIPAEEEEIDDFE
jgi:hypothetical protein